MAWDGDRWCPATPNPDWWPLGVYTTQIYPVSWGYLGIIRVRITYSN
jgi:hypothetical protein